MENQSKNVVPVRQLIETVTAFLTASNSVYITLLIIVGGITPFVHMMIDYKLEGIFGFPTLRYFFYCLIIPITFICFGFLLRVSALYMRSEVEELQLIRTGFKIGSIAFLLVGGFFLIHTLWPMTKDFPASTYYLVCTAVSVVLCFSLLKINTYLLRSEARLKKMLRNSLTLIISVIPRKYFNNNPTPEYVQDYERVLLEDDKA